MFVILTCSFNLTATKKFERPFYQCLRENHTTVNHNLVRYGALYILCALGALIILKIFNVEGGHRR